jgi:hypothetical protein
VGQAPNRRYVVSWVGVPRNTSSSDKMSFQAVLSEETGDIRFNYLEVNPQSSRGGGAQATIGLEAPSGTAAAKYCFKGNIALRGFQTKLPMNNRSFSVQLESFRSGFAISLSKTEMSHLKFRPRWVSSSLLKAPPISSIGIPNLPASWMTPA